MANTEPGKNQGPALCGYYYSLLSRMLEDFLSMYPNCGANSPNKSTLCLHPKAATDSEVQEKTTDI